MIKRWGYADCKIYRYKGKKLVLYDKLPGLEQWNAIKGKKVLNRVGYISGTNGKGRVIAEIHIEPPTVEMWDMTYFRPEYILKKGKVQMVEKEYQLWSCNIKAAKDWNVYEKASLQKSNKKLFVIKKGTKCIANRIKVTPKYTFIRFVVKGTKKTGWSIFPTSQMEFHA